MFAQAKDFRWSLAILLNTQIPNTTAKQNANFHLFLEGPHDAVQTVFVQDGKVIAAHKLLYDLSKEKPENGELLEYGKETRNIDGKNYECTWEKRKLKNGTVRIWPSPEIDFEPGARTELYLDDGKICVTELFLIGPSDPPTKKKKR